MAMRLGQLLEGFASVPPEADVMVSALAQDSRDVSVGSLFVALSGTRTDGLQFVGDAVARGAAAVICDATAKTEALSIPVIPVPDLRDRLGHLADRFFGFPSRDIFVIGVTGTNGKTTCTQLLAQVLDAPDAPCAIIGTIGNGFPGKLMPGAHTTPDPIRLHSLLAEFRAAGAKTLCMEVSSHALEQRRVEGVRFDIAVFTNLTRDHLDYHGDMSGYASAKERLFEHAGLSAAVINCEDGFGRELMRKLGGKMKVVSFGFEEGEVRAVQIVALPGGLELRAHTPAGAIALQSHLLGRFNAQNLLAVVATLSAMKMDPAQYINRLEQARAPAGRMECFGGDERPLIVVDYAHTPDALEKVLDALRAHARGQLWCVFGCGGDRDRGKRPLMGAVAERLADQVVVTDDNPRHESGDAIIADIVAGMERKPEVIRDREQAIRAVVARARAGDVVLIAGKGHEDYQQVADRRLPFSDQAVVCAVLQEAA